MSKTKDDKKKPKAANSQKSGSREIEKPVSTASDLDQPETGAGQSQQSGSEAEQSRSGEIESGDNSLTVDDAEKPENGSSGSQDDEDKDDIAQANGTESGDEPPPTADGDKKEPDAKKAKGPEESAESSPPATPAQKKDGLSDEQIDELVAEINSTLEKTAEKGALGIGTLLLDKLFKGKLESAFSHSPYKDNSFKSIADHPDIAVDPTTLARWVKGADLARWFEAKGHKFSNLTCSHYIALLKVRTDAKQLVSLADEAEKHKLSVRELKRVIDGPKPAIGVWDMLTKNLGSPGALLKDREFAILIGNQFALSELKDSEIRNISDKIETQRGRMQEYMSLLLELDNALNEIRDDRNRKRAEELNASLKKDESAAA